jgi:hypothetical protein
VETKKRDERDEMSGETGLEERGKRTEDGGQKAAGSGQQEGRGQRTELRIYYNLLLTTTILP